MLNANAVTDDRVTGKWIFLLPKSKLVFPAQPLDHDPRVFHRRVLPLAGRRVRVVVIDAADLVDLPKTIAAGTPLSAAPNGYR